MPTYEFRLPDGTIIERSYKISEVPSEIPNPNGEGVAVRIISGGAGLLFKGSGFYLTDYGRNAHRTQGDAPKAKSGESAASPAKTDGGASSSGAEAKPASAPKTTESKSSASDSSAS
jgi:predicted nucleic acid-binding Zn ribbon protein